VLVALIREVGPDIGRCELTHLPRVPIDAALAAAQHRAFGSVLADLGCEVVALPAEAGFPDAVFVEDTAVVVDEIAVVLRPGAASRQGETPAVAAALAAYREIAMIGAPGTVDGGDVLRIGRQIYVGSAEGGRSNAVGIAQLEAALVPYGYRVSGVPVRGCLHLKSAVTAVAPATLLINRQWVDPGAFAEVDFVDVHPSEPHAANALLVGGTVIYPASHPRTAELLAERGIALRTVDVSELQKAEGAVTCCSILLEA
jgi:dimethylargininase